MKLWFGRFVDCEIADIPPAYICWCLREIPNLDPSVREAMRLRLGLPPTPPPRTTLPDHVKAAITRRFRRILEVDLKTETVDVACGILQKVLDDLHTEPI